MTTPRNLAVEESAAWLLAQGSIKNGSLRGVDEALAWAGTIGNSLENPPWIAVKARRDRWAAIEASFGRGAALNLEAPMVIRMRQTSHELLDPTIFVSAEKFRASPFWDSNLYSPLDERLLSPE
jgi:hypothetical protein